MTPRCLKSYSSHLKFRASSIMKLPSCAWWLTLGDPQMDDCLKCQTATATPAEPGGLFGFARESFRRCLPEGDVVLRKMEQCARNNDQVCAFTGKEVEEGNREIKQRAREHAEADAEIRARQQRETEAANSTATIKGNFAAACQSLDDARQVSTGLLFVGKYLADKLQTGECRKFSAGEVVDIFERWHFMSCIRGKFGDGSCRWISNRWFLYPLTYTENAVVLSAGTACYTLKNANSYKFTVITVWDEDQWPPEFRFGKYLADADCEFTSPDQKIRIVDRNPSEGMACIQS